MKIQPADARSSGGRAPAPSQSIIRERRLLTLIAASAAAITLAGLSLRFAQRPALEGATLREAVTDLATHAASRTGVSAIAVSSDAADGGYTAVAVAQQADCDGNLGVLGLLDRSSIASRIPHRLLLVQGQEKDTIGLRRRLPASMQQARIALLTMAQRSQLRQLGHVATPSLLLFDRAQQLRYASTSPPGPVERTVQLAVITRLVTNHPDPHTP